ncbi:MAG TPA: hypothetical protein VF463_02350 [Sphingobium sp.]
MFRLLWLRCWLGHVVKVLAADGSCVSRYQAAYIDGLASKDRPSGTIHPRENPTILIQKNAPLR